MRNRKRLSLLQRVQVICEYDLQTPKPTIQMLANKYNVSFPQIRNILLNRESILKSHQDAGGDESIHRELHEGFLRRRHDKIEFLDRVMYEYIQRILALNISTDDEQVLQKANEVKERIALVHFKPTLVWLNKFKQTYGIPSFDLETMRKSVPLPELKRRQLTTIDLIAYVSSLDEIQESANRVSMTEVNQDKSPKRSLLSITEVNQNEGPKESVSPPPLHYMTGRQIFQTKKTEKNEVKLTLGNFHNKPSSPIVDFKKHQSHLGQCHNQSRQEITTLADVVEHLRILEEYAMLHDNYRAIGLLTQLEDVFTKTPEF